MRTAFGVALATLSALVGCVREKPPSPRSEAHYLVPPPWQGERGVWFYPSARFGGSFSGLAVAMTGASGGTRTADGAAFDPAIPAAAVQSLQLPVVLRVTDLMNGRQMLVRADDRGPADPGRAIALDAAAMRALGMSGVTPVSITIDAALSQGLADRFDALPRATETAPLDAVSSVPLAPPGVSGRSPPPETAASIPETPLVASTAPDRAAPVVVPTTVATVPVGAVALVLDAGTFSGADAARSIAAAVGGVASPVGRGRHPDWNVTRGPLTSVADADVALDQAEAAGISGARIVARDPSQSPVEGDAP